MNKKKIIKIIGEQTLSYGLYGCILKGTDGVVYQLLNETEYKPILIKAQIKKDGDKIFHIKDITKIKKYLNY